MLHGRRRLPSKPGTRSASMSSTRSRRRQRRCLLQPNPRCGPRRFRLNSPKRSSRHCRNPLLRPSVLLGYTTNRHHCACVRAKSAWCYAQRILTTARRRSRPPMTSRVAVWLPVPVRLLITIPRAGEAPPGGCCSGIPTGFGPMKIAIFGSCVSRDTCEFLPDAEVVAYVARHSVTSLESPHGTSGVDLSELTSTFQKRMVTSDLRGNGVERIVKHARDLDLVLIDLVDERRGYWLFPNGTTMTNSLEIESCGAARDARRAGARLVEF